VAMQDLNPVRRQPERREHDVVRDRQDPLHEQSQRLSPVSSCPSMQTGYGCGSSTYSRPRWPDPRGSGVRMRGVLLSAVIERFLVLASRNRADPRLPAGSTPRVTSESNRYRSPAEVWQSKNLTSRHMSAPFYGCGIQQLLKPAGIDRLRIDLQRVARGAMVYGRPLTEPVPQSRDVLLQRLHRAARLIAAPERLEQGIGRDRLGRVQREHDEQRPLLGTVEPNWRARNLDLERPQQLHGDFPAHGLKAPTPNGQSIVTPGTAHIGTRAREHG
jgi:hypothetical protein